MGKKKNKGKKEVKTEESVINLIKKVDKNEKGFLEFICVTPSEAEMNNKFIPQPSVDTPSINWFSDDHNLTKVRNPEWAEAWDQFCISKGFEWYEGAFSSQPEEVQKEGIKYMVDFVRKTRRSLMYKKYEYALQKKKKEEGEIDELKRQVEIDLEFIEGQKDKGKGKKKEKEQAKIDKDKGISIRESSEKKRANWSTAGDDDRDDDEDDDVDDSTTIHGRGESAKSDGESGERKTVDEAKEDGGVVEVAGAEEKEEVKEKLGADEGRVDNTVGFLVTRKTLAFPVYEDGDNVVCYKSPFSLKDWLLDHKSPDSRWLPSWPDMGLNNIRWSGDRLKRESLTVMQSLLSAVLDYHEHYGPHGNLSNRANIILSQHVDSFGGSQKVWFQIQLFEPISLEPKILNDQFEVTTYLTNDMLEVDRVFREILEGRDLDTDMECLLNFLLKRYPFNDKEAWKTQVLRNFPGFWYGQQRASFIINVYYNWMCDPEKSTTLLRAIQYVRGVANVFPDLKCIDWIKKISTDSIFYEVLIFSSKVSEDKEDDDPKPRYSEGSAEKVLKYMRDTLHHYLETHGGGSMKIRQIELYLSNLFKGFVIALYMGMCKKMIFLS